MVEDKIEIPTTKNARQDWLPFLSKKKKVTKIDLEEAGHHFLKIKSQLVALKFLFKEFMFQRSILLKALLLYLC